MKPFDLIKETNLNLGTDFKSPKELWAYARIASDRLRNQWLDSGRTDYSIYKDPEYIYEGLICFDMVSTPSLSNLERYTRVVKMEKGMLLDIYNGIGLTSVFAAMCGFTPAAVNDNPPQVEFMQKSALRHLGYEIPVYETLAEAPEKIWPFVVTLEVLEHFTEPLTQLRETISKVAPGGVIVESTGFCDPALPGHFETYFIDGVPVSHRGMSKPIKNLLKEEFYEEASCVNRKPRIWRMKSEAQSETILWSHKKDGTKGRFRCLVRDMERYGLQDNIYTPGKYE